MVNEVSKLKISLIRSPKEERELKRLIEQQAREMAKESNPIPYSGGNKRYGKSKVGIKI